MSRFLVAVGVLIALVASSCSSSSSSVDASSATSVPPLSTDLAEPAEISLGDREAGFGPGSLVAAASIVAERLEDLPPEWIFATPPYQYEPLPSECGFAIPMAMQGLALSRQNPDDAPFGDAIGVEVSIYDDAAAAAAEVAVMNGPNALACDVASVDLAMEQIEGPSGVPGVEVDFGDGIGAETPLPFDTPNGAGRAYEGKVSIGSEERRLEQLSLIVAVDRFVLLVTVVSTSGGSREMAIETADLLLSEPMPEIDRDVDLDEAMNVARAAVLGEDVLPSYYEETDSMRVSTTVSTECFGQIKPSVIAEGPAWLNITPGLGASEVSQTTLIFPSADEAENAVAELRRLGTDCVIELAGLPEPMFKVIDSRLTTSGSGAREVTSAEVDYIQTINGADFDVGVALAVVQVDEFVFATRFIGLAGDSPDLGELAVKAAERSGR